ncbi:MAG: hypothetical protein HYW26_03205 [Candidatus Aenigmarchaeota archaeon]|nr:hypothetical protein [Candidatus Aenigmarchaeota archaeon]
MRKFLALFLASTIILSSVSFAALLEEADASCTGECNLIGYENGICDRGAYDNEVYMLTSESCTDAVYRGISVPYCICYTAQNPVRVCGGVNEKTGLWENYIADKCEAGEDLGAVASEELGEPLVAKSNMLTAQYAVENDLVAYSDVSDMITGAAAQSQSKPFTPKEPVTCASFLTTRKNCEQSNRESPDKCYFLGFNGFPQFAVLASSGYISKQLGEERLGPAIIVVLAGIGIAYYVVPELGKCVPCSNVKSCGDYYNIYNPEWFVFMNERACKEDACNLDCKPENKENSNELCVKK